MQDDADSDDFWLYDLRVETIVGDRTAVCRHVEGESFRVEGELLIFDEGQKVSMYALAALLPVLPVKQRMTSPKDWNIDRCRGRLSRPELRRQISYCSRFKASFQPRRDNRFAWLS